MDITPRCAHPAPNGALQVLLGVECDGQTGLCVKYISEPHRKQEVV